MTSAIPMCGAISAAPETGTTSTSMPRSAKNLFVIRGNTVATLTPEDPAVYMAMADSYRDTDRKPQAVAAYRKFLEVAKPDDMMRPVAQRFIELLSQ